MNPSEIISNEFLTDIGDDHVAIAADGRPYGRASTREALQRACPDAAAYITAADLINDGLAPKRAKRVPAYEATATTSSTEINWSPEQKSWGGTVNENALGLVNSPAVLAPNGEPDSPGQPVNGDPNIYTLSDDPDARITKGEWTMLPDGTPPPVADGSAFDHDGDGRVGGQLPKAERKRKPKS